MNAEELLRIREEEDKRFGFLLSYYNGKFARTYEKRFDHRRDMDEFIARNKVRNFTVRRFVKEV